MRVSIAHNAQDSVVNLSNTVSYVSAVAYSAWGSANSALSLVDFVSRVAYAAFNNELGLSETVAGVQQGITKTISSVNTALDLITRLNNSFTSSSMLLGTLNSND